MFYLNILLCFLMIVFMGVQYNDPDGPLWMAIYAIPALWTAIAAFKPHWLQSVWLKGLLSTSMLGAIGGLIYFWPTSQRWWSVEVWYDTETAREGMGMMVVIMVLLVVWGPVCAWGRSQASAPQGEI